MNTKPEPTLTLPDGHTQLLLHTCCAPCAGKIIEDLQKSNISFKIFFYNPNIHPEQEYLIRKEENIRYAQKHDIPFIDADYDTDIWFERAKGLENEPERGARCTKCFDLRLERTALYAYEHHIPVFATSLGISRWKDLQQVNDCGLRAASHYPGLIFWDQNWRKHGGSQRMITLSKEEQFYQQEYCGCIFSLRESNRWRKQNNRELIQIGVKYYGLDSDPSLDK